MHKRHIKQTYYYEKRPIKETNSLSTTLEHQSIRMYACKRHMTEFTDSLSSPQLHSTHYSRKEGRQPPISGTRWVTLLPTCTRSAQRPYVRSFPLFADHSNVNSIAIVLQLECKQYWNSNVKSIATLLQLECKHPNVNTPECKQYSSDLDTIAARM